MQRSDWLLLLLHAPDSEGNRGEPLDTIRIMKGLFIIGQRSSETLEQFYQFEPYLYGPCSFPVYDDIAELQAKGLVEQNLPHYRSYRLTRRGLSEAEKARPLLSPTLVGLIAEVKEFVLSHSFTELLQYVYEKWPRYTTRSVFRPAQV
jgi:uncharacterized protein YwgA